jgi:hypothetical protein
MLVIFHPNSWKKNICVVAAHTSHTVMYYNTCKMAWYKGSWQDTEHELAYHNREITEILF